MNIFLVGAFTAFGLGALTVIHPCPLSTNIAAVSLLCGRKQNFMRTIMTALLFVIGEMVAFALLGILISMGMLNIPVLANILQVYMRQLLGPFLIIVGMMLTGILLPGQHTLRIADRFQYIYSKYGILGSMILGVFIALSFCPMSAATFFGVLIPLAISSNSVILYPVIFGIGTGIPLLIIVILISRSVILLDRSFFIKKATEIKLRWSAGITMILLGIFMSLRYIFKFV